MSDTNNSSIIRSEFNAIKKTTPLIERGLSLSDSLANDELIIIVRELRDKLNTFFEILIKYSNHWDSIPTNQRQSYLVKLRTQYMIIVDLIEELVRKCKLNETSSDLIGYISWEDLAKEFLYKEFLYNTQYIDFPRARFYSAILEINKILPKGLAITEKSILKLLTENSF